MSPLSYTKHINILVFILYFLYDSTYLPIPTHLSIKLFYLFINVFLLHYSRYCCLSMIYKLSYFLKPFENPMEVLDSLPTKKYIHAHTQNCFHSLCNNYTSLRPIKGFIFAHTWWILFIRTLLFRLIVTELSFLLHFVIFVCW